MKIQWSALLHRATILINYVHYRAWPKHLLDETATVYMYLKVRTAADETTPL